MSHNCPTSSFVQRNTVEGGGGGRFQSIFTYSKTEITLILQKLDFPQIKPVPEWECSDYFKYELKWFHTISFQIYNNLMRISPYWIGLYEFPFQIHKLNSPEIPDGGWMLMFH